MSAERGPVDPSPDQSTTTTTRSGYCTPQQIRKDRFEAQAARDAVAPDCSAW